MPLVEARVSIYRSSMGQEKATASAGTTEARTTTEVIHDHLLKRLAGQVGEDIEQNYAPDVVLLTGSGKYVGKDGARSASEELARLIGDAEFTYDRTVIDGQYAFLEWSATSPTEEVRDGADSYVVVDGRIVMQTVHYRPMPTDAR